MSSNLVFDSSVDLRLVAEVFHGWVGIEVRLFPELYLHRVKALRCGHFWGRNLDTKLLVPPNYPSRPRENASSFARLKPHDDRMGD